MALEQPAAVIGDKDIRPGYNETGVEIASRRFVKSVAGSAPDSVELCGDGERAMGVSMQSIEDEERGNVQTSGKAIVVAAVAIAAAVDVASDATGKAVVATTGEVVMGRTVTASTGADEEVEIELNPQGGNLVA